MASLFSRIRSAFRSPADRRLEAAAREAWADAPQPIARPSAYGGNVNAPPIDWFREQPPGPPTQYTYTPGYNDHTFQQFSAPQAYEGWDLARIDAAVAMMRRGTFVEASNLLVAILGFAPVLAALAQAIAPILAIPRRIAGGDKGIAREVKDLVIRMITPRSGLDSSPYFPLDIWGTLAIYLRMYGFAVLQHIDGDVDPDTGIRMRYTRIWEPWAVRLQRTPRKRIAITTDGEIEIRNDGKFTFVADEQEPQFTGALVALGDEAFGGKLTQAQRAQWLDFFGDPKLVATLPDKIQTSGEAGLAMRTALERIYGPAGRGVLPGGADMKAIAISGEGSTAFRDALVDRIIHIFMVLTGSAGTIGAGGPTGAGPYVPQKGGAWNVRHDLIARPTIAIARGINQGHIAPFCDINFSDVMRNAKRAKTWVDPVLEIPIVAPDRDERIDGEIRRHAALVDQVKAEKEVGAVVTNDRVKLLAERFEAEPFTLAPNAKTIDQIDVEAKAAQADANASEVDANASEVDANASEVDADGEPEQGADAAE